MKRLLLNRIILICKIILLPILCIGLLHIKDYFDGFQFVVMFGLAIIPLNINKLKHIFVISLLLSVLLSFLVFFLSFGLYLGIGFVMQVLGVEEQIGDFLGKRAFDIFTLIPIAIISPLLMFYSYKILFKIEKTSYFNYIKWISIMILVTLGLTNVFSTTNNSIPIFWQFIMALALQLILYQNELKDLFKPKNE